MSVRYWSGKPYNSKQVESFIFENTDSIGIQKIEFHEDKDGVCSIKYPIIDNRAEPTIEKVATNDGLSLMDFKWWFKSYDLSEPMAIIHFTDFRY